MERTADISLPLRVGMAVVGAGALLTFAWLFRDDTQVIIVVLVGIALVALALLGYRLLLKRSDSRRARNATLAIANATGRKSSSINDPAELAKVADIARKFEEGLEKFRTAGKDLYSIPWYMLVGEPGSGKTEALRHCGVPTPTGLADLPGVGGTINMNWWFTNQAIVLDTAGRLMFQSVEPAKSGEWSEFLKLLNEARPNCPINGLLLVIPADSLIRDTNNKIEEKARKIALQFDVIQRTLGVRFPVFCVITKSDLINGFREFFNTFTNPDAENQMLGWSNPATLDAPFDPDQVDRHLEVVRNRLLQYRAALLLDPVNTEDAGARRADQADALYAFPDSLTSVAPRLRLYLERIFVQGEWSPKPLFLRGIYFTSSMREGSALDRELADLLGVPVDQLPEGKVWERDRAQFLKELFTKKVFREKGLVTRATNASGLQRRRQFVVFAAAFLAIGTLLVLTFLGSKQLKRDIVGQKDFWVALKDSYTNPKTTVDSRRTQEDENNWSVLGPAFNEVGQPLDNQYLFRGGATRKVKFGDEKKPLADIHREAVRRVPTQIAVPAVFKPLAGFKDNLVADERQAAFRKVYEETVLKPVVKAAAGRMSSGAEPAWTKGNAETATAALRELIRIEANTPGGATSTAASSSQPTLDPLFQYVLKKDDPANKAYADEGKVYQQALETLYPAGTWPPPALKGIAAPSLNAGVDRFAEYWAANASTTGQRPGPVSDLRTQAAAYEQAVKDLAAVAAENAQGPGTLEKYTELHGQWKEKLAALVAARDAVDKLVQAIEQQPTGWPADASLLDLYRSELTIEATKARNAHQSLINEIPDGAPASLMATRSRLAKAMNALPDPKSLELPDEVVKDLDRLQAGVLARPEDGKPRLYEVYAVALKKADAALPEPDAPAPAPPASEGEDAAAGPGGFVRRTERLPEELKRVEAALKPLLASVVADVPAPASGGEGAGATPADAVRNAGTWVVRNMVGPHQRYRLIGAVVAAPAPGDEAGGAPKDPAAVAAIVAATPQNSDTPVSDAFPAIPLTARAAAGGDDAKFDPNYHRKTGPRVIQAWLNLKRVIAPGAGAGKPRTDTLDGEKLAEAYNGLTDGAFGPYLGEYVAYWTKCLDEADDIKVASWAEYHKQLPPNAAAANEQLELLSRAANDALRGLEKMTGAPTDWAIGAKIKKGVDNAAGGFATFDLQTYQLQCKTVLAAWRGIGPDAAKGLAVARQMGARKFHDVYIMPPPSRGENLVTSYWRNLAFTGLELLAKAEAKAPPDLTAIKRFPLAPPKPGVGTLTTEQVEDALAKVVAAVGAEDAARGESTGDDGGADGAAFEPRFTKAFAAITGKTQIPDEAWLKQARRMAVALTDGEGLRVTVSTVPSAQQAKYAEQMKYTQRKFTLAGEKVHSVEVEGGGGPVVLAQAAAAAAPLMADRPVSGDPGETLEFHFQRKPAPEPADDRFDERVSGSWAVLKLLYPPYNAVAADTEGKVWHVELQPKQFVDTDPTKQRVWVELKFDKPIVRFPTTPAAAAAR
jgi:hypothetical protein